MEKKKRYDFPYKKLLGSGVVGAVTFPVVLATTQLSVFKPLRLSYRPGLQSSMLGLASVTVASLGTSVAALGAISLLQQHLPTSEMNLSVDSGHLLLSTASGVVMFRALGGRFGAVLPSNLMRPGAFAVECIPALREAEAPTRRERELVQALGKRHGCHTCGTRQGDGAFVADHQPPSKLLHKTPGELDSLTQRQSLYPHCKQCSAVQGGLLRSNDVSGVALRSGAVRTHGSRLRVHHMFLPVPFLIAYLSNMHSKGEEDDRIGTEKTWTNVHSTGEPDSKTQVVSKSSGDVDESDVWMDIDIGPSFPLLIVWRQVIHFLDSFTNPLSSFHVTLWAFTIVAALGTLY